MMTISSPLAAQRYVFWFLNYMKSMTGFGIAHGKVKKGKFRIEARSVNHRFCEVNVRMPPRFLVYEYDLQTLVRKNFSRGKIDVFVREEGNGNGTEYSLDLDKMEELYKRAKQAKKSLGLSGEIGIADLLAQKECYSSVIVDDTDLIWAKMSPLVQQALTKLQEMRFQEGKSLQKWFRSQINLLKKHIQQVEVLAKQSSSEYRKRLQKKIDDLMIKDSIPEERLALEVVLVADRADVTEEIVRFKSHLAQLAGLVSAKGPVGRKLDFILQEMFREINTVGSKSQNTQITKHVIDIKSDLEKIREQVQNVE
jgi:uncharacterized protein (TIGR00255 family)